jgi:uncharacterized protein (TIGR03067 family)
MTNDLERLQGTWSVRSLEVEGQKMPASMLAEAQVVIKGKRFLSTGMGAVYEGTLTLNSSVDPPQLDMKFDAGPEKGNTNLGIYKFDGENWKLCLATRGDVRPSRFASKPGSGFALEILTRANAVAGPTRKKSQQSKPASSPAATEFEGEWQMVSGVMDGVAMKESDVQWVRRITKGNETTVVAGPQTMLKVNFTHDATKSPKTIDYVILAEGHKGKPQLGIYEFDGDLLRVCMAAPGRPRATKLESNRGDGATYTVWRRI